MYINDLPHISKLRKALEKCPTDHMHDLYEMHDGKIKVLCMQCPFSIFLVVEEEKMVRDNLDKL